MSFTLSLPIQAPYLLFPVCNGGSKVILQLLSGGKMVREFNIELTPAGPADWWAFYDVSPWLGQTLELHTAEDLPAGQAEWLAHSVHTSPVPVGEPDLYHEPLRPQFHFTTRRGWNNDPNGLVYYQGEYHLFYQLNPFGIRWGNMHWGHAVSPDLLHWSELPVALYQRSLADMAFSGGGLVDADNTSGWKTGSEDPLVIAFTSTGRGECLAYSLDRGRSFTEAPGNPLIAHQGRDPKIIWYAPGRHWVMILYDERMQPGVLGRGPGGSVEFGYAIYTSPDLHSWQRQSFLAGDWFECPELFELEVAGRPGVKKWVIHGCIIHKLNSAYVVGSFDGQTFTPEMEPAPGHSGPAFYAAQNFNHDPLGRQVMLGWLQHAEYPGMPFSQGMTVPLELSLQPGTDQAAPYRLCFQPIAGLAGLRASSALHSGLSLAAANQQLAAVGPQELIDLDLTLPAEHAAVLQVGSYPLSWDPAAAVLSFAGQSAPLAPAGPTLRLRLLLDRGLTEIFAEDGRAAFAAATHQPSGVRPLSLSGPTDGISLAIHRLRSIWPE